MTKYLDDKISSVLDLFANGYTSRQIAEILKIKSKSTVNNIINRTNNRAVKKSSVKKGTGARMLYIDIETSPCIAAVFGRFKINLSQDNIIENGGQIISACWMFEGDDNVSGICMTPEEALVRDDSRLLVTLYDLLENTDVLVYQNGDAFDLPQIKARFATAGLPPPKSLKSVDTLKIARQLRFPSNRLDSLGDYLGVGRKQKHTGIDLWVRCLNGEQEALDEMYTYNSQDVTLLRDVYMKLRAFDSSHVNLAQYYDDAEVRCAVCASTDLQETGNSVFTQVSEFKEVRCNDCGHVHRTRSPINSKEKRKSLLLNTK